MTSYEALVLSTIAAAVSVGVAPAHASCALAGDSIAFGVGRVMRQCLTDAKGGIPSADVIARVHPADVLFVSAGSNDPNNRQLESNLEAIRAKASADVVWIEPMYAAAAAAVKRVAAGHKDPVVQFVQGSDGVYPKSHSDLAASLLKYLN